MTKYQGKETVNSRALSLYIGSHLMPGRDGKPQRHLSEKEAYELAKKQMKARER